MRDLRPIGGINGWIMANDAGAGPSLIVAPSINGTAARGETLTLADGTWTGTGVITYARQWYRDGAPIAGATGSTYVLVAADDNASMTARVTATDDDGPASRGTNAIGPVLGAPLALTGSTVSGTAQVGQVVTASDPTYQGVAPITLSYQWQADGANITGATSASYTITSAEYGAALARVTTGTNVHGTDDVTSDATAAVLPLAPVAAGALADQTYTLGTGAQTFDVSGDFAGQGLAYNLTTAPAGVTIASGTGVVTTDTDVTALLAASSVVVRATNEAGFADSAISLTTQDVPDQMAAPTLLADGGTITVTLAADPAANNSPITSRDVRYSKDEATWTAVTGVTSPHDLTGLDGETLYYVQTRAVNGVGAGGWSASATATTGAAGFDPASLFSGGQVGVWLDPSDLSTLFQDDLGTVPVTADGQSACKVLDKSGNGLHAVQPLVSKAPTYRTDGSLHWLEFDGVDDFLLISGVDFGAAQQLSATIGVAQAVPQKGVLFWLGDTIMAYGGAGIARRWYAADDYSGFMRASSFAIQQYQPYAAPRRDVVDAAFDLSGATLADRLAVRVNGSAASLGVTSYNSPVAPQYAAGGLGIGASADGTNPVSGDMHVFLMREGDWGTARADVEQYIADQTGVTL